MSYHSARIFLRDLEDCLRVGKIVFSKNGVIIMTGCRAAATVFPALLATLSGCVVKAALGIVYPKPGGVGSDFPSELPGAETGEWLSGDGGRIPEDEKSGYLGWMEYTRNDLDGQRIGEQLAAPFNACLLHIW
jgi:hypothetical protein